MAALAVDLQHVVFALSDALDLVGIDDAHHGKRVAYMAVRAAERLGWSAERRELLYFGGMLHDCGVSRTDEHQNLATSMERDDEQRHCLRGARMLAGFAPLAHLAETVRYHHTHWDAYASLDLPAELTEQANLIFLADRVDVLMITAPEGDDLLAWRRVRERIAALAGSFFKPQLVEALLAEGNNEAFWLTQRGEVLVETLRRMLGQQVPVPLSAEQLRGLARMFADIVDVKSPFTSEHSAGVARLAVHLATRLGLSAERVGLVEIAALLHDLGKLRVPDRVLDKPGPLDPEERAQILRHSFDTYQILSRIDGFREIAAWAGFHHESVDGAGYPFHKGGVDLSVEARLIAVADVVQALVQDRPYRQGLTPDEVRGILDEMVVGGHLDREVVALVDGDAAASCALARGER